MNIPNKLLKCEVGKNKYYIRQINGKIVVICYEHNANHDIEICTIKRIVKEE